jgi:hypothetical protein
MKCRKFENKFVVLFSPIEFLDPLSFAFCVGLLASRNITQMFLLEYR